MTLKSITVNCRVCPMARRITCCEYKRNKMAGDIFIYGAYFEHQVYTYRKFQINSNIFSASLYSSHKESRMSFVIRDDDLIKLEYLVF